MNLRSAILLLCVIAAPVWAQNAPRDGLPVDKGGGPTVDPTKNVLDLVKAESKYQDAMREAADKLAVAEYKRIDELRAINNRRIDEQSAMRADFAEKLSRAESSRLDSIRQVDRDDVSKTAASNNTAINTLAKQTTDLSTTLAKQVADTATATESRQTAFAAEITKRLSSLELSSSERTGKQQVSDPQLERLNSAVERLVSAQSNGAGIASGSSATTVLFFALGGLILTGLGLMLNQSRKNTALIEQRRSKV